MSFNTSRFAPRGAIGAAKVALILCIITAPIFQITASRATVRIVGNAPHAALWKRVYDAMPTAWKSQQTVAVREVTDEEMESLVSRDSPARRDDTNRDDTVIDAFYDEGRGDGARSPSITIRESLNERQAAFVFTHEYGHFVWYKKLTRAQRSEYTRLWKRQFQVGRLVTEYAADDEFEGFAESFAHYVRKPSLLQRMDSASFRFVENVERMLNADASSVRTNATSSNSQ